MTDTSHRNPGLERALTTVGAHIRTARVRRGWSQLELARRAGVSEKTLRTLEKDPARVSFGTYADVLDVLGLAEGLTLATEPSADELGLALERKDRRKRGRTLEPDDDF